ncbi:MAG: DNA-formamidopyrimidine glycosylase [Planctomycetales bacterium]|nr:DNA-formamidopyrimidine glycosylase [Planctomycetales bacterium]
MPELPEVETMRRGILPIQGTAIHDVLRPKCQLKPILLQPSLASFRRRVRGCILVRVGRLGKRIVLDLNSGDAIVVEPRMTGLVLLADPPNRTHLRLQIMLRGGAHDAIWFWDQRGLGTVRLFNARELIRELGPQRLGPDALVVSAETLRERLRTCRRPVKVALMDQQLLAGVGNLYASEILHVARIHPQARCDQLTKPAWFGIHAALQDVLTEAIRYEGSTLADGTYRNALNRDGGYQNHHRVYSRHGLPCPRCRNSTIVRIVQAQRSTFFCPQCQRKKR